MEGGEIQKANPELIARLRTLITSRHFKPAYAPAAEKFLAHLEKSGKPLSDESIGLYLEMKRQSGFEDKRGFHHEYKAEGINAHIYAIKHLLRVILDHSPNLTQAQRAQLNFWLQELKPAKIGKEKKQVDADMILSPAELKTLIENAGDRDSCFMQFLAVSGVRVSEMCGIMLSDIEYVNGHVEITVRGKGDKERPIRVNLSLIMRIREVFNGSTWLFETQRGKPYRREYIFMRIQKAAQLLPPVGYRDVGGERIPEYKKLFPHLLRHTFASGMLQMHPEDLAGLSSYLGHADPSITSRLYIHGRLSMDKLNGWADRITPSHTDVSEET